MSADPHAGLAALSDRIGHQFDDITILYQAMAHRSWVAENPGERSNERLEYLGDAVLGWAIADISYHRYDDLAEGMLTELRKNVVNEAALAEIAAEIGLGDHILLGKGETAEGGAGKASILSDTFEAMLAAVYLDGGVYAAHGVVRRLVAPRLSSARQHPEALDAKTELQELAARRGVGSPVYRTTSTGPDHAKEFVATVTIDDDDLGEGAGASKKAAEQAAARVALDGLR